MKDAKACIYDNPSTMRREKWANGTLTGWYTAELIEQSRANPMMHEYFQFDAWQPDTWTGDLAAMDKPEDSKGVQA